MSKKHLLPKKHKLMLNPWLTGTICRCLNWINWTLETQNTFDQMFGNLLMRTLDKFHSGEEKLLQSTNLNQESQVKELKSWMKDHLNEVGLLRDFKKSKHGNHYESWNEKIENKEKCLFCWKAVIFVFKWILN